MIRAIAFLLSLFVCGAAHADYDITAGSGTTIFAFTCFTTKVCPSHVPINSAGTELFTSGNPGYVTGIGLANPVAYTTQTGTAIMGWAETSATALTTNNLGFLSLVPTNRALRSDLSSWAGTALGTPTNFGTTPTSVVAGSVNASMFAGTTATVSGSGTATGALRVELPTNGTGVVGLNAGTAIIGSLQPATSGGWSLSSTLTPNNTTAVVVKASAGQIGKIVAFNNSSTIAYMKIYNATSATCGSGTPVDRILIPSSTSGGAGVVISDALGDAYSTGITYCVTTGYADNDTTAPAASAYIVNVHYK